MDNVVRRRPSRVAAPSHSVVVLLGLCVLAGACGQSRASIGLSVVPNSIPVVLVQPCAGVFAMFPCSATNYLDAKWTVTVSALNDMGGRGTIEIRAIDAASGQPLADPAATVSGDPEVLLGPHGSVTLPVEWRRSIPVGGPGRIPPPQLGFVITVQLTDNAGHRVSETVTARESLPRPWQVF